MPSKFVEIVLPSHRQGNCIPSAAIRWPDFGLDDGATVPGRDDGNIEIGDSERIAKQIRAFSQLAIENLKRSLKYSVLEA